jgi:hypothetical protein
MSMPLVRYFVFTGGMLLGLLFLADWNFPIEATVAAHDGVDRSIIRIRSSHKWPDAVRIDTDVPIVMTAPGMTKAPLIAVTTPVSAPAERVRQAYAFEPSPQKSSERTHRRSRATPRRGLRETGQHFANSQPSAPAQLSNGEQTTNYRPGIAFVDPLPRRMRPDISAIGNWPRSIAASSIPGAN